MLDRIRNKVLLAMSFAGSLVLGLVIHESTAWAFNCGAGAFCTCGSWDLGPNGAPILPEHQWEADCDDLAAYCHDQNNNPNLECTYSGGALGGSCRCIAVP